jgi:N-acetylglucosamine malate deacetylase 1
VADHVAPGPVLVVAAHPDDEVLGCGGTIARMADEGRNVHVLLLADGETSRDSELLGVDAREKAAQRAGSILGCSTVTALGLPDNRLDSLDLLDVVKEIEKLVHDLRPSTVLTHHVGDVNVDHRITHEAVISACRSKPGHPVRELLFFEVVSSTEWRPAGSGRAFEPNWFVDVSRTWPRKLEALKAYEAELERFPHPRSFEAVEALARVRGATVGVGVAEAFVLGRTLI